MKHLGRYAIWYYTVKWSDQGPPYILQQTDNILLPSAYATVSPEPNSLYAGKRQEILHLVLDGEMILF